jgi:hypothetical protein
MAIARRVFAAVAVVALAGSAQAGMVGMHQFHLDFTSALIGKQVKWTSESKLVVDKRGLVLDAPATSSARVSLQTTEPFATGISWRPTREVTILAHVTPGPHEVKLDNGQTYTPYEGRMYVRYSPDAKHWSTWQVLHGERSANEVNFSGEVSVPASQSAAYDKLLQQYDKLDVPWRSDEEAAVQWIVKAQPDFFARELPFIGYVELLYEADLAGGQPIAHLDVDVGYSVGGAAYAAKDPKVEQGRNTTWRYRAK